MERQDINAEYERIFGTVHYPVLFDHSDVEYNILRREIIGAPQSYKSTRTLPFENLCNVDESVIEEAFENFPGSECYNADIYNIIIGIREHISHTLTGILSVLGNGIHITKRPLTKSSSLNHNHLFWITKFGRCKACGYFDKETKNFYICANSLISANDDIDYIDSSSYRNRHRIINKYGISVGNFIKIQKNVKCRSAVSAARYALGAMVSLDLWHDSQGRTLYDAYPEYFFR